MSIYNELFDWQKQIVDKYLDRKAFGIFLDMGLGKTPISLAFAEQQKSDKILIISTNAKATETEDIKGSFLNWLSTSNIKYNLYNKKYNFIGFGPKKYQVQLTNETKDVYITNYESLFERDTANKKGKKFDLNKNVEAFILSSKNKNFTLIVDESHKMKSLNSLQSKAIFKIKSLVELMCINSHYYLLTGTPFTKGFEDLYTQLNFLGLNMTKTHFYDTFCIRGNIPTLQPWQQPIVGYRNVKTLYRLVHVYGITMKTEDVIELPDKAFCYHIIKQSSQVKLFTRSQLYEKEINTELKRRGLKEEVKSKEGGRVNNPFYKNIDYPSFKWISDDAASFYLRYRQLSIGFQGNTEEAKWFDRTRLDEFEKLLTENEDNYIVFYNYTPEFVELYEICEKLGYKIDIYNGIIKSERFYNEYNSMTEDEKVTEKKRVLLANYASGSTAKNWQAYNKCVLFSVPLFGDYQQGLKRVHRIGQTETVIYHVFYQDNMLDRKMLEALENKKEYDLKMFEFDMKKEEEL